MDITVTITGVEALQQVLRDFPDRARRAVAVTLNRLHEEIMTVAKQRCPVAIPGVTVPRSYRGVPGSLRASGFVLPPQVSTERVVSQGGFGGPSVDYAIYVHEDLTARHAVGQAKFYESALLEGSRNFGPQMAEGIAASLGRL
jgi:hypothetical protein